MIRYVDNELKDRLAEYVRQSSVFACRIACLLKSYGTGYSFADFYLQLDSRGKPTAAAVKYYSDMTIMLSDGCDTQEILEFIGMTAPSGIMCPPELFADTGSAFSAAGNFSIRECVIMKLISPCCDASHGGNITESPPLNRVWELISSCGDDGLSVPAYEDFLPDISHKLRHGTAMLCAYTLGGAVAGAAMTVAQSDTCALIGAVAVSKEHRRKGIGSACIRYLCARLNEKGISDIYILREADKNELFYCSLGFTNSGQGDFCEKVPPTPPKTMF